MAANQHGSISTTKKKTQITIDSTAKTKTVTIDCAWASYASHVPLIGAADPDDATLFLSQANIQRGEDGVTATVVLTYKTREVDSDTWSFDTLPVDYVIAQAGVRTEHIKTHPDWISVFKPQWDEENDRFTESSEFRGIDSYDATAARVITVEFSSAQPSSPISLINTLENPPGYAGTNKWKVNGASVTREGRFWKLETEYEYNRKGWNTSVYNGDV